MPAKWMIVADTVISIRKTAGMIGKGLTATWAANQTWIPVHASIMSDQVTPHISKQSWMPTNQSYSFVQCFQQPVHHGPTLSSRQGTEQGTGPINDTFYELKDKQLQ